MRNMAKEMIDVTISVVNESIGRQVGKQRGLESFLFSIEFVQNVSASLAANKSNTASNSLTGCQRATVKSEARVKGTLKSVSNRLVARGPLSFLRFLCPKPKCPQPLWRCQLNWVSVGTEFSRRRCLWSLYGNGDKADL